MVSFTTAFVAAMVAAGVLASPAGVKSTALAKRNSPNSSGMNNGFYYQFWDDGTKGNTVYTNGPAGSYSVTWTNVGDFTSGKGWSKATPRTINFSGTVNCQGNFYLAVYTWSQHGENYILEDWGTYNPCSQGQNMGTLYSDGSNYQVCLVNRGNNYLQNWSVRLNKRSSGTVTTANHYNYYNSKGMTHNPLSDAAYQIVSTEGYGSTGSASITVSEDTGSGSGTGGGSGSTTSAPPSNTSAPPATSSPPSTGGGGGGSGNCAAHWAQCGGTGWTGATCCASGTTCKYSNAYYSQCL